MFRIVYPQIVLFYAITAAVCFISSNITSNVTKSRLDVATCYYQCHNFINQPYFTQITLCLMFQEFKYQPCHIPFIIVFAISVSLLASGGSRFIITNMVMQMEQVT